MSKSNDSFKYANLEAFQKDYEYDLSDEKNHLGLGTYGQVTKAWDNTIHEVVAIKIGEELLSEFEAAKDLKNRNIANYIDCYQIKDKNIGTKDYAIMKYYPDGNLAQFLANNKVTEEQKRQIVRGVLEGLKYLHANKRIHRDLKPANILIFRKLDKQGNIVEIIPLISDFGLARVVKEDEYVEGSDIKLSDGRGTIHYKAPEQIAGEKAHFNLDLWAFGVILYEIILGERPFSANSNSRNTSNEIMRKITEVIIPDKITEIPQPYQAIIRRCLVKDIHERVRKAQELIDLLDEIPSKLTDIRQLVAEEQYDEAKPKVGELLKLRPALKEAQDLQKQIDQRIDINRKMSEAYASLEIGDYEKAKTLFTQILKLDTNNKNTKEALEKCEKQLKIKSLLESGNKLLNEKKYQLAKQQFEQVLKLEPNNELAKDGIAKCNRGIKDDKPPIVIIDDLPTDPRVPEEPTGRATPIIDLFGLSRPQVKKGEAVLVSWIVEGNPDKVILKSAELKLEKVVPLVGHLSITAPQSARFVLEAIKGKETISAQRQLEVQQAALTNKWIVGLLIAAAGMGQFITISFIELMNEEFKINQSLPLSIFSQLLLLCVSLAWPYALILYVHQHYFKFLKLRYVAFCIFLQSIVFVAFFLFFKPDAGLESIGLGFLVGFMALILVLTSVIIAVPIKIYIRNSKLSVKNKLVIATISIFLISFTVLSGVVQHKASKAEKEQAEQEARAKQQEIDFKKADALFAEGKELLRTGTDKETVSNDYFKPAVARKPALASSVYNIFMTKANGISDPIISEKYRQLARSYGSGKIINDNISSEEIIDTVAK